LIFKGKEKNKRKMKLQTAARKTEIMATRKSSRTPKASKVLINVQGIHDLTDVCVLSV
jgi:hypothetical protein